VAADPIGVGDVLAGVAEGLAVCDGLGDRVGLGEVLVGVRAGAVGEELVTCWVAPAGVAARSGPGRTRM